MSEFKEDSIENKNKFLDIIKKYKKILFLIVGVIFLTIILFLIIDNIYEKKNKSLSELFNQANILITKDKKIEASKIYEKIVFERNKFYSPISLNSIIENDLTTNSSIDEMFVELLKIRGLNYEEKNLIKLKRGIYFSGQNNENELLKTLNPLINENSIWKTLAAKTLKDFYLIRGEKNKSLQFEEILKQKNK
tara:strand:- start:671 stop:1249 length:579 start_codon:yes stop_codon:yes gene_type:complete